MNRRGREGEAIAARHLESLGYRVLARNWHGRGGEIDLVCQDGETLVFVEVKARRDERCGTPQEAVTWHKRRRLAAMADDFLARARLGAVPCRFDVVAVRLGTGLEARVEVFPGAFSVGE